MAVVTAVVTTFIATMVIVATFLDDDIPTVRASVALNDHRVIADSSSALAAARGERERSDQPVRDQVDD
ncbi:MAG: hypothetical protein AABZ08_02755 [Planctomycetota bacterium]